MRKTAILLTCFIFALFATAFDGRAEAVSPLGAPADFVRAMARDSARIVHATNLTEEERHDALDRIARQRLDRNRLSRFLVRTTSIGGVEEKNFLRGDLLDEATDEAVHQIRRLMNDPAIARLYPSKVALLPNGRALVESRIDYQGAPSRVWRWQLTRVEASGGRASWGLLDIVADDNQSVALATRRMLKLRLAEMEEASAPRRTLAPSTGHVAAATTEPAVPTPAAAVAR